MNNPNLSVSDFATTSLKAAIFTNADGTEPDAGTDPIGDGVMSKNPHAPHPSAENSVFDAHKVFGRLCWTHRLKCLL